MRKQFTARALTEALSVEEDEQRNPIHWEVIDEAYINAARTERALMRNAMLPASACQRCSTPTCCTGTLVPVTGAEIALIIKVHRDVVEKKKEALLDRAGRVYGYSLTCPFQCEESGKCLIHDVAPWNCAMYFVSNLEDPEVCNYALQKRKHDKFRDSSGSQMQYGKISMAGVSRVISDARTDSDTLGLGDLRATHLCDAIIEVMSLLDPETWGDEWRNSQLSEMEA